MDVDDFYAARRPARCKTGDLLVLSADGKGIVMRPDALRTGTATRAARAGPTPKARLSGGVTLNHKRMAEIGAVYDATPAPRTSADILASAAPAGHEPAPGPVATNKWLTASVVKTPAAVIERVFEEADRRDPKHRRTWVALVDGANHQIQRIKFEAKKRAVKLTIIVDFVHVLEYLWNAAGCLYPDNDRAAEEWVHRQATRVVDGHARKVAGTIRRAATNARLDPTRRKPTPPPTSPTKPPTSTTPPRSPRAGRSPPASSKAPAATSSKTGWTSPAPAGDSPAPKPSSNYARSKPTATSTPTGTTTSPKNDTTSTKRATSTTPSRSPYDSLEKSRTLPLITAC